MKLLEIYIEKLQNIDNTKVCSNSSSSVLVLPQLYQHVIALVLLLIVLSDHVYGLGGGEVGPGVGPVRGQRGEVTRVVTYMTLRDIITYHDLTHHDITHHDII